MKFLYVCLTYCYVAPAALLALLLRPLGRKYDIERLGLGLPQVNSSSRPIWLVASSVGEVTIALKVIERLKQAVDSPVILSVTTPTGRTRAMQASLRPDVVFFHPFDTAGNVLRALTHFNPALIVLVETELWPVLMEKSFERSIPVAQISGRMSERSHRRYRALRPYFAPLLRRCSLLLMQSKEDAGRLRDIAGESAPIEIVGSVKEDYLPPDDHLLKQIQNALSAWNEMTILTCGSTRTGEEEILCDAFVRLKDSAPELRLIIAPRHLERVGEIEQVLRSRGLSHERLSKASPTAAIEVLVLDTIGNLNAVYHFSRIAFVGGTLTPIGGHNLLEPALAGCPVLHGPHYFGQLRGHELLKRFQMGFAVADAESIDKILRQLMSQKDGREDFLARALQLRKASSHILDEYIDRIRCLIKND